MPKISYGKLMMGWERINRAVGEPAKEPVIEERRRELDRALADLQEAQRRQISLRQQTAENMTRIREAVARGKEAESRLRAFIKGTYGRKSTRLYSFGLRRERQRRPGSQGEARADAEPAERSKTASPATPSVPVKKSPKPVAKPVRKPAAPRPKPSPAKRPRGTRKAR